MARYNPPPNWPAPPAGWSPPPDWQPDPVWGPPPPGWQVWLDEPARGLTAKRALAAIGAALLVFVAGVAVGTAGTDDPLPESAVALAGPAKTITTTARATVTASPESTVTATATETVKRKVVETVTATVTKRASSSGGSALGSGGACAPGYSPCIPPYPPDLDCADVNGPIYVTGNDPHGLDGDGDGIACES